MVEKINNTIPIAIRDLDSDGKNLLMVAAEHRQARVFDYLKSKMPGHMLRQLDNKGNNILHYAATREEQLHHWRIPGAALQMQWEIKWYKVYTYNQLINVIDLNQSMVQLFMQFTLLYI